MPNDFKETYNNEGKSLSELLQEWINENRVHIVAQIGKQDDM